MAQIGQDQLSLNTPLFNGKKLPEQQLIGRIVHLDIKNTLQTIGFMRRSLSQPATEPKRIALKIYLPITCQKQLLGIGQVNITVQLLCQNRNPSLPCTGQQPGSTKQKQELDQQKSGNNGVQAHIKILNRGGYVKKQLLTKI